MHSYSWRDTTVNEFGNTFSTHVVVSYGITVEGSENAFLPRYARQREHQASRGRCDTTELRTERFWRQDAAPTINVTQFQGLHQEQNAIKCLILLLPRFACYYPLWLNTGSLIKLGPSRDSFICSCTVLPLDVTF